MKMTGMAQMLNHQNPNHARDSFLRFNKLRREGILCDLTILVQGEKFKAHRVVLAACSDYFFTAICGGKSTASVSVSDSASGSHMTIELQYVTRKGFVPLLDYAYTSDLNVNAADVIDVLSAASCMQMFDVATACSEFMRSSLSWTQTQSHFTGFPLMPGQRPAAMINGQNGHDQGSGSPAHGRYSGLPEAVNNLLQATSVMSGNPAAGSPALGRPPVLIPISSMNPYDINFRQWAGSMSAGTHNLISRIVNGQSNKAAESPPSLSPVSPPQSSVVSSQCRERRRSSLQPQTGQERPNPFGLARSEGGSPVTKENEFESPREQNQITSEAQYHSSSNNNNNNDNDIITVEETSDRLSDENDNRRSAVVELDTASDEEINPIKSADGKRPSNPQEDAEDSWQSLQKLYSFGKGDATVPSPSKSFDHAEHTNLNGFLKSTMNPALLNHIATSTNGIKMALDKYKDGISKTDKNLPILPALNGMSVHRAILHHQQQLLAQQQQHQQLQQSPQNSKDSEKIIPDLPAVPPGGQYMSVRRRTLQSNVPKPHQCQICGSRFTRFHNLKQHIKLHSGVKPYECDECGKKFTRNYTLRLHKMKHVGLRNYQCGTCNAAFTSVGEFRAHLRITMHSHPLANGSVDSPRTQDHMLEPEDLSNSLPRNVMKFGQFDYSLLNYGVGSPGSSGGGAAGEGSTGTISPTGIANPPSLMIGMDSPQLSDRSLSGSPQDLSKKRSLSDAEDQISVEHDSDHCRLSLKTPSHEMQFEDEVNKRRRLSNESPCPYKSEKE